MVTFAVALVSAFLLTGALLPVLQRTGLVDVPNHRSSHTSLIPRGGGLAVMAAVVLASAISGAAGLGVPLALAGALAAVGLVDDLRGLSGAVRLLLQMVAGVAVVSWADDQGASGSSWPILVAAGIFVVGYVNAFNFMDGVNAMSALNGAVAGVWFAFLGEHVAEPGLTVLGLGAAGASLGFLPWNAPGARVFLGDVGSYGVGLLLATLFAWAWASGGSLLLAAAPLMVYGADTGWVLIKRALGRRPLMEAHREHVYQRMVDLRGWSHLAAAATTALATVLVCLAAWLGRDVAPASAGLALLVLIGYLGLPQLIAPRAAVSL